GSVPLPLVTLASGVRGVAEALARTAVGAAGPEIDVVPAAFVTPAAFGGRHSDRPGSAPPVEPSGDAGPGVSGPGAWASAKQTKVRLPINAATRVLVEASIRQPPC